MSSRIVAPHGGGQWRCAQSGALLTPPPDWALLLPGDAAHTRRVKEDGDHWLVQEPRGRRIFSRGVLAPRDTIERVRLALERERSDPAYARKLEASRARRQRQHEDYVVSFRKAVLAFLDFAPVYADLAEALATQVTEHTTPVGSGTVGRTQRISLERKVEAAVIAWLRHQTTNYDDLEIPRIRGKRREVRQRLARRSREILNAFRRGEPVDPANCRLHRALRRAAPVQRSEQATLTPPARQRVSTPTPTRGSGAPLWRTPLHKPSR